MPGPGPGSDGVPDPDPVPGDDGPRFDLTASFGQRVLARAIDLVVVSSVLVALGSTATVADDGTPEIPRWVLLVFAATFVVYEAGMVGWSGATLGKRATHTAVVSVHDGRRPAWIQAVLRALVPVAGLLVVPALGLLLVVVVYLSAAFDRSTGRGAPDRIAGTVVVQRPRLEPDG